MHSFLVIAAFPACAALSVTLVAGCASSSQSSTSGVAGSSECSNAGGHCLSHNAPSAKGQGPADCAQFGTWFYSGPLTSSPLSCDGEPPASGGWVECCVR